MSTLRFESASSALRLQALLRRARNALLVWFAFATGLHLSLSQLQVGYTEETAVKPLTTLFVKRQPRLTKPLELKKRPQPKWRRVERVMVTMTARANVNDAFQGEQAVQVVGSLARPTALVSRAGVPASGHLEPRALAGVIPQTPDAESRMDMSLEMVDIGALDTGKYHAMIVQNPHDKRSIEGYFHLAAVYSVSMNAELQMTRIRQIGVPNDAVWALPQIVAAINKYTAVTADMAGVYTLDSEELLHVPWAFIAAHRPFRISLSEAGNVGRYLTSGGFLMTDDDWACRGRSGDISLRGLFQDALGAAGRPYEKDWVFAALPNSHPIYHCYFDFEGIPIGNDYESKLTGNNRLDVYDSMDGVTLDGRLVGIVSNKDYVEVWGRFGAWVMGGKGDYIRQDQLAVNLVLFALTQEGSITYRVMAGVTGY